MSNDLLTPSLTREHYREIKTYDISKLFYVAFLGGMIPLIVLGCRNANWLQVDKKVIALMTMLGVAVLLTMLTLAGLSAGKYLNYEKTTIRLMYNAACVLFYLGYYLLMQKKFKQHILLGGDTEPLLKSAAIWWLVGLVIEAGVVVSIFFLVKKGIIGYVL